MVLLLSTMMIAGSLVKIPYSSRAELEQLFANPNLTVHLYTNSAVYATAEQFEANTMEMIDENAFQDCEVYTLLYNPEPVVYKGAVMPFKNDGAVAIFNKRAQLPELTRDFPTVTDVDERIREMMDQVNMDSLEATVQHLQDYQSRIWNSDNAFTASDWIASKMQALGLEVEQQGFSASTWMGSGQAAPNVIGIQRGTLYPDTYVVCGSHFDSFSYEAMFGGGTAPGADDNATGVASVLESARIMTQYEFEYSIVYCAYGCEEMGLYGSEAYASRCQSEGMDIIGYFNNDMNGYLNPGDDIHIDCIYPSSVEPIGTYYMTVANIYFPEMVVRHVNFNEGDSDHTSFNNHGYMGIYPFEDYQHYSPNIHTPQDLIGPSVNSFAMSQRYCQMNIGCLAEIANPVGETPVVECNPVTDFYVELPVAKELSEVYLWWQLPEEGSTGELNHFDVYRDNSMIATVEIDPDPTYHYYYMDTITVGASAEYFIMAVYSDGCEAASQIEIGYGVTGVEETTSHVSVYPNPAKGDLTVKAEGLQRIVIINMMGQQLATVKVTQDVMNLALDAYPKGIYTIQLVTANGVISRSVVLK